MPALAPVDRSDGPGEGFVAVGDGGRVADDVNILVPLGRDGDAVLAAVTSTGALIGVNLIKSDCAHITEMGQSYAMK